MGKISVTRRLEIAKAENSLRNKVFTQTLSLGGKLIENEKWVIERIEKCRACTHFGKVEVIGLLKKTDGCTICKCPMITKPFFLEHPLGADCPKSLWQEIDKKYKKL